MYMYVFAYYLCKGLCYVPVLIMELPVKPVFA
jgi:hypothetical protein